MKNLTKLGVRELNSKEVEKVNGGWVVGLVFGVIGVYLVLASYAHENHHK